MSKEIDQTVEWINNQELEAIKINGEIINGLVNNSLFTKIIYFIFTIFSAVFINNYGCLSTTAFLVLLIVFISFLFQDAKYTQLILKYKKHYNAIIRGKLEMDEVWKFVPSNYDVSLVDCLFSFQMLYYPTLFITTLLLLLF